MNTPWGRSDYEKRFDRGLTLVGTPSHGGFLVGRAYASKHLSAAAQAAGDLFGDYLAYEEDCDAAIILLECPQTRAAFTSEITDASLIDDLSYWKTGYLIARGLTPNPDRVKAREAQDAEMAAWRAQKAGE
jgi:hypothetical protein